MKVFEWFSQGLTEADYFIQFTPDEIRDLDKVFPEASSKCREVGGYCYGFVDLKGKRFIPLKVPAHAFGGCYNDYPPYGKNELDIVPDFSELSWQEDVDSVLRNRNGRKI